MCSPWTAALLIRCQKKQKDSTSTTCSTSGKKREKDRERTAEIYVKIMSRCLRRCQQISLFLKEKSSKQKKRYQEDTTHLQIYDDLNTRREMRLFSITVHSYKSILMKWIKHRAAFAGYCRVKQQITQSSCKSLCDKFPVKRSVILLMYVQHANLLPVLVWNVLLCVRVGI